MRVVAWYYIYYATCQSHSIYIYMSCWLYDIYMTDCKHLFMLLTCVVSIVQVQSVIDMNINYMTDCQYFSTLLACVISIGQVRSVINIFVGVNGKSDYNYSHPPTLMIWHACDTHMPDINLMIWHACDTHMPDISDKPTSPRRVTIMTYNSKRTPHGPCALRL